MSRFIQVAESYHTMQTALINTIEIADADAPSGRGGFGVLFKCESIDGKKPADSLLIKLLDMNDLGSRVAGYNAIRKLQERMAILLASQTEWPYDNINNLPSLKAFPKFSFKGVLNGEEVMGYAALDLSKLGFMSFQDILDGVDDQTTIFDALPFLIKFQIAYWLVQGFELFNKISYVHADINPQNIFINMHSGELAMIDYDGGAIIEKADDETLAFGKLADGEWIAPELEISKTNTLLTDRWSVAVALHYLFFGRGPFFFLTETSITTLRNYLLKNRFYPVNLDDNDIGIYEHQYLVYNDIIKKNIPGFMHYEMVRTYQEGFFNPVKRTSYTTWLKLLAQTQQQPNILRFEPSKRYILRNTSTRIYWKVSDAVAMKICEVGTIGSEEGQIDVTPHNSTDYTLSAIGRFGKTTKTISVTVLPLAFSGNGMTSTLNVYNTIKLDLHVQEFPGHQALPTLNSGLLKNLQLPKVELKNALLASQPIGIKLNIKTT
jgi:serine/threonine protein kinase